METINVLIGLLAVKELEIKTLHERLAYLSESVRLLTDENTELYKALEKKNTTEHHELGFNKGG